MRDGGDTRCRHVEDLLATRLRALDVQIAELQELRATVGQLHDAAAAATPTPAALIRSAATCNPRRPP